MSVDSLNAALSGLRVAQRQMGLISTNIANAATPGYTRKILPLTDFAINGESIGVAAGMVRRQVNTTLQFDLYAQTSLANASTAQLKYLKEIQSFHGNPNDANALPNMLQTLGNDFSALADSPTSPDLLTATVHHAQDFAERVNDLSDLYTRLRNDVQTEMQDAVSKINALLVNINDFNNMIARNINTHQPTADLEDQRDLAVTKLAEQMDISYYTTGDGRLFVQTRQGEQLVDVIARKVDFNPNTLGVNSTYPASAAGIYIDNPTTASHTDFEITNSGLGGRLGGLLELRDDMLPKYQASLDEMAQKTASRFAQQGLKLFTDTSGRVPDSVAPPTATGYAGFSQIMQVNERVVADTSLLRLGTEGETITAGSNRIINRIVQYAFGMSRGETANGTTDISAVTDLFTQLGLDTAAKVTSIKNIDALGSLDNSTAIIPGTNDTFSIQLGAAAPFNVTIAAGDTAADLVNSINNARVIGTTDIQSLGTLASSPNIAPGDTFSIQLDAGVPATITIGAADTAADLVNNINAAFPALASLSADGHLILNSTQSITMTNGTLGPTGMAALGLTAGVTTAHPGLASISATGRLVLQYDEDITLASGSLGGAGFEALGLTVGTTPAQDPSFTIQLDDGMVTTITIADTDTNAQLLAKFNAISGLHAVLGTGGGLELTTDYGTNITLTDGQGKPLEKLGLTVTNIAHDAFRTINMGPNADINTGISGADTLVSYGLRIVSVQATEAGTIKNKNETDETYRATLDTQLSNESGVNLDEEMGHLIVVQQMYGANAKMISASIKMLQDLIDAI